MKARMFKCRLCRRRAPWSLGCDDTFPHLCDDCWARVSMAPEAVAFRAALTIPEAK